MEYLMTYGWALLVIVIVIGILLVMNPFSAPQGCRFDQIGFTCDNPVLSSDPATSGYLYMTITNGNNNAIRLYKVACIQDKSNSPPAGMAVSQAEKDSPLDTLQRQDSYQLNNDTAHPIFCTKADGKTKIVVQRGTEFSGKVWIFYNNEEDGTNYPVRSAAANVVTKAV